MTTKNSKEFSSDSHIEDIDLEIQSNLKDLKKEVQTTEPPESTEKVSEFDWVKEIDPETKPEGYDLYRGKPIFGLFMERSSQKKTEMEANKILSSILLYEINQERKKLGLEILKLDPSLTAGAWEHAEYLAKNDTEGHYDANGRYYRERTTKHTKDGNYEHTGENNTINAQFGSIKGIVQQWLKSHGHRPTITKRGDISPTDMGIGLGRNKDGMITRIVVWTAKLD